jgi:SAM-dependent methyltransferase
MHQTAHEVLASALGGLRAAEALGDEPTAAGDRRERVERALDRLALDVAPFAPPGGGRDELVRDPACGDLRDLLRQSHLAERMLTWPRGYPGDFETIDLFYAGRATGHTEFGCLVDAWIRAQEGPRALLRRPANLARVLSERAEAAGGREWRVLVVASGPVAEVFEFLERAPRRNVRFTCLDVDEDAHAFVRRRAQERGLGEHLSTITRNVLRLAAGRDALDLPPQHLTYSVGLNDYLDDRHSVSLLNWMCGTLAPGGSAVLGNLRKGAEADFASTILNWPLAYREPEDLERLFAASVFGPASRRWTDDATGRQLYVEAKAPDRRTDSPSVRTPPPVRP